jgi:hypothetical protein
MKSEKLIGNLIGLADEWNHFIALPKGVAMGICKKIRASNFKGKGVRSTVRKQ